MAKRATSIQAILDRAQRDFSKLEADYQKALSLRTISADLKIDIKNISGNLRSALDYLAADIRETCCPAANPNDRFYFPVLPTVNEFRARTRQWYPSLELLRSDVWNYFESVQPFQIGCEWLGNLNRVNNENKHEDLVEQTRVDNPRVVVTTQGGGTVSWTPGSVRFGSGVYIGGVPVNPATQLPHPHPSQKVEQVVWVDFRFRDPNVSVLGLLKDSIAGAAKIATDIQQML
jgi:hypothetical protein